MLDVIADFWKPVKKTQTQEKLQPDQLQVGSTIGFGFVPQAMLSGRRLTVSAINTYQFGDEALTSFVLAQGDATVSMIIAESEGEHYLAISRRVPISERMKLFDSQDLDNILTKSDVTKLPCKDTPPDFKGWIVAAYKREIQGMKGRIFKGDFRKAVLPAASEGQEFEYTLLVSDSNEHAIEIEKYGDGRVEVYATVYRRMNDIGEISHPGSEAEQAAPSVARPDIKLASGEAPSEPVAPAPKPVMAAQPSAQPAAEVKPEVKPETPAAPVQEVLPPAEPVAPKAPEAKKEEITEAVVTAEVKPEQPAKAPEPKAEAAVAAPVAAEAAKPAQPTVNDTKPTVANTENTVNGVKNDMSSNPTNTNGSAKLYVQPNAPENYTKQQEVKAVSAKNGALNDFENDSIECDLRVANKIIDEAIRNEMRLTDIVRRIIELPVAYPESVQIPVTLTDEDYALLAIRYGMPATDRNGIKRRILEDLNDFSGGKKLA